MSLIFICEDSAEGILSGVYEAYLRKVDHENTHLCAGEPEEQELFAEYVELKTNVTYATKVAATIQKQMGEELCYSMFQAMASYDPWKADAVYHTIVLGITHKLGCRTADYLTNSYVRKIMELSQNVTREIQHMQGFLRFEELESSILYSKIGPKNNIITFLAPHFSNRFRNENFIIYDVIRNIFVLHKIGDTQKDWVVLTGTEIDVNSEMFSRLSLREKEYQACFCSFVKHIGIESRRNYKLQRNMLPIRFREYMTEFTH